MPGLLDGLTTSTGWSSPGQAAVDAAERAARVAVARGAARLIAPWPSRSSSRAIRGSPRPSSRRRSAALERRGLDIRDRLAAPADRPRACIRSIARSAAPVLYLPEYLQRAPRRVLRGLARGAPAAGLSRRARGPGLRDLARDRTPNRVRRFGQALVLAAELPAGRRPAARPFPAHAGLGRALRRADARAALVRSRPTPRTSGPRPTGRSARSSPSAAWAVTCTASRPRPSGGARAGAAGRSASSITGSTSTASRRRRARSAARRQRRRTIR